MPPGGSEDRKARGAFFTPPAIATFLARWAIAGRPDAKVLDPTCGEGVFLLAAGQQLREVGAPSTLDEQVFGIDVHEPSLHETTSLLEAEGLDARLVEADFFEVSPPGELLATLPQFDAVIGNPPFVRYQQHVGAARRLSATAAMRQGVRLSGLASSWAALLVHAGAFLKPDGRLAMVIPAELLTVGYAEPVRQWLRRRFEAVKLVLFERLQFANVLEDVVLLLAHGSGGCDAFSVYYVEDADDLYRIQPFDELAMTLAEEGKWTDLLLSNHQRQIFRRVTGEHFVGLGSYGAPELGTVTGANAFFTLTEATRREFDLQPDQDVRAICPPGTRYLRGLTVTSAEWKRWRDAGEAVWILYPEVPEPSERVVRYLRLGEEAGVPEAYKCRVRSPWWRPPLVSPPDLFFTYMSHRYPRLIANQAGVSFVNSMHGVRLNRGAPSVAKHALPLATLNSLTMLGAEIFGRSYGGGILKMEPHEAASLPVPNTDTLRAVWALLGNERRQLDRRLRDGRWAEVIARVDEVVLGQALRLSKEDVSTIQQAAKSLRARRLARSAAPGDLGD